MSRRAEELPKPTGSSAGLHSGDRMTREEFHRIYETMPEDFKAELIGGTVCLASPLRRRHARDHLLLGAVFVAYSTRTPGLEAGNNGTILLGDDSEPQPDLFLRVLPESGGQSRTTEDDYVEGPPELVAEVAQSRRSMALRGKRNDYTRNGVLEYVVLCLKDEKARWFDLKGRREIAVGEDGVIRSLVFPGLWIDTAALFEKDWDKLQATLDKGMTTPEYLAFAQRLAQRSEK